MTSDIARVKIAVMPPYLLLSFLLGAINGVLFYLWRGRNIRDLIIYLLTGVTCFLIGHYAGYLAGLDIILIGPIYIIEATVISWLGLFLVHWLKF